MKIPQMKPVGTVVFTDKRGNEKAIETEKQSKALYVAEFLKEVLEMGDTEDVLAKSDIDRRMCKLLLGESMKYENGHVVPDVEMILTLKQFK